MGGKYKIRKLDTIYRIVFIFCGVALNVGLAFLSNYLSLPFFLDTIGTVIVGFVGGALPGVITAILTNFFCMSFNSVAMYFGINSTLVAIISAYFGRNYVHRQYRKIPLFIFAVGIVCGVCSVLIQWHLFDSPQNDFIATSTKGLAEASGLPYLFVFIIVNVFLNIIDKGISIGIALNVIYFLPEKVKEVIQDSLRRQNNLSEERLKALKKWSRDVRYSMRTRLALLLVIVAFFVMIIMSCIEIRLYFLKDIEAKTETAVNVTKFTAPFIDGDKIDEYLREGEANPEYKMIEEMLYTVRNNAPGVVYLYVAIIDKENFTYVFDLDAPTDYAQFSNAPIDGYEPGTKIPIEEEFIPYIDDLVAGNEIPPVRSNKTWEWVISAYSPIYDSNGNLAAYVGADASINYITEYIAEFMWHSLVIMSGFIVVILAFGMWNTTIYLVNPINSMGLCVEEFIKAGDDQKEIDKAVKSLRQLDIQTGDEIEKLYNAICDMALSQAEQIRSIRNFSDSTAKMQDGLIITMADLVEKRDSNSGSHIQKTASYAKIIAEGLKKKGYYAGKVTPKFISDVVRSAPLHDIGKINVPDSIVNKSGKLTREEEEIIKTHTTAGKKIMENAISTVEGENYLKEARNMAAYHHERWDGTGYPEGLHGEVIPLSARIMAVADQFDNMTSSKNRDKLYSFDEAIAALEEGAGTQFDPKCVEVFVDAIPEVKVVYRKYNKMQ